jgi:cyclin-dependent kinase inhibitor 3
VHFPVVEGAGGADGPGRAGFVAAHEVIAAAAGCVEAGGRVVMHCRGGVGRAGMMGACALLLLGEASTPSDAIALVRRRRCKQAVETRRQEDFVKAWHRWWVAEQQRTHVGIEDEQGGAAVTPAPATAVEAAGVGAAR